MCNIYLLINYLNKIDVHSDCTSCGGPALAVGYCACVPSSPGPAIDGVRAAVGPRSKEAAGSIFRLSPAPGYSSSQTPALSPTQCSCSSNSYHSFHLYCAAYWIRWVWSNQTSFILSSIVQQSKTENCEVVFIPETGFRLDVVVESVW